MKLVILIFEKHDIFIDSKFLFLQNTDKEKLLCLIL